MTVYPQKTEVSQALKDFIAHFYTISDTFGADDKYLDFFTDDGTLVMASRRAEGRENILALRKGMWEHVASRHHTVDKVFPLDPLPNEFMLYGTVEYGLKSGRNSAIEWSGRAEVVNVDGVIKFKYYQVYLDTAAVPK